MKTIKKLRVTIALKSILVILLLSWITILPSCTVARYDSNGVRIERQGRSDRQLRKSDRNDRRNDRNNRRNDQNDRSNDRLVK